MEKYSDAAPCLRPLKHRPADARHAVLKTPCQLPTPLTMRPLLPFPLRLAGACLLALLLTAAPQLHAAKPAHAGAAPKATTATATATAPQKVDYSGEYVNFGAWKEVSLFLDDMVSQHGFDRSARDLLFAQVRQVDAAIQLIKPAPPGKPKNWQAYSKRFVEPVRIDAGARFWIENAATLARAESEYGVPAEIIVGIIGVETVYGRNTGRFRVLDTLTPLAFDYPPAPARVARMAFFRAELESTLLLARQNGIDPLALLGSYAGAVGLPQFMPSSILKHAVDFDGDGSIDLRNSIPDAIGSVANFLQQHGWQAGPAPVYRATVSPERTWEKLTGLGLQATLSADVLRAAGVTSDAALPPGMLFGLVDLQNGAEPTEYWLASNNFFTITLYNRSYFYAMSVLDLGRAVRETATQCLARHPPAEPANGADTAPDGSPKL